MFSLCKTSGAKKSFVSNVSRKSIFTKPGSIRRLAVQRSTDKATRWMHMQAKSPSTKSNLQTLDARKEIKKPEVQNQKSKSTVIAKTMREICQDLRTIAGDLKDASKPIL